MNFARQDLIGIAVAMDIVVRALELDPDKPVHPWPPRGERMHALIYARKLGAAALREAGDPPAQKPLDLNPEPPAPLVAKKSRKGAKRK